MLRIPFEDLEIVPQSRKKLKKRYLRESVGVDTETYLGRVKIIADSFGRCIEPETANDLLDFLLYKKYRGKLSFFWNIQYDWDAIIKWLPLDNVRELYDTGKTVYGDTRMDFIKRKYFGLVRDKHRVYFYDMFNFLPVSLESASRQYLDRGKSTDVDSFRLNLDEDYWKENFDRICRYCVRDAKLTRDLADYFWNLVNTSTGMLPHKPYSQGSYAQDYFLEKCYIPKVQETPVEVLEYAYNTYYGGRFELLQRGYFPEVYIYDIKSAYPAQMAQMPDFTRGNWFYTDEFNRDYLHAFYACTVDTFNDRISPIMQKYCGINCYCNGGFSMFLTGFDIDYISRHFPHTDLVVYDGYYWVPDGQEMHPFYEEIERLYHWKEAEKDENTRYVVKMILNSLSGKLIQTVGGHTGRLFNPMYAAECTAKTRLKLLEAADLAGFNNVIGFSTDSVHLSRSYNPLITRDDHLGDFMQDFHGEGVYIMSDVYTVKNNERVKNRFRGMYVDMESLEKKRKRTFTVWEMIEKMKDSQTMFEYRVNRPLHLGEVLGHVKRNISSLNIFVSELKRVDINGDHKRAWEQERFLSGFEVLDTRHVSAPLIVP